MAKIFLNPKEQAEFKVKCLEIAKQLNPSAIDSITVINIAKELYSYIIEDESIEQNNRPYQSSQPQLI
jgi:hypothetical protein